jgi:L-malate glycosyltransferase
VKLSKQAEINLKILFVLENQKCGGLDSFLVTLINNWAFPDDELALICNQSHPGLEVIKKRLKRTCQVEEHGILLFWECSKKLIYFPRIIRSILLYLVRYLLLPYQAIKLVKIFKEKQPDFLFTVNGGYPSGGFGRTANIAWNTFYKKGQSLHSFHNLTSKPRWFESWVENCFDKMLLRSTDHIIGVSASCIASMQLRKSFQNTSKISFIYNGIEETKNINCKNIFEFKNQKSSSNWHICLMLGTYEKRKGHEFLCQVFQKVLEKNSDALLIICGDGTKEEIAVVENLIQYYEINENVHLLPFQEDTSSLFQQAEILLIGSQEFESFGLTSVEAMMNKLPVVATTVGGIPEVVKNGEGGYCFDKDNIQDYSQCVIDLLANPELRNELGEKGYLRYKKHFSSHRMALEYGQLVHKSELQSRL